MKASRVSHSQVHALTSVFERNVWSGCSDPSCQNGIKTFYYFLLEFHFSRQRDSSSVSRTTGLKSQHKCYDKNHFMLSWYLSHMVPNYCHWNHSLLFPVYPMFLLLMLEVGNELPGACLALSWAVSHFHFCLWAMQQGGWIVTIISGWQQYWLQPYRKVYDSWIRSPYSAKCGKRYAKSNVF